jgi:hypothetical protein
MGKIGLVPFFDTRSLKACEGVVVVFTFTVLRALLFTASGKTPAERFYCGKKGKKKLTPVLLGFLVFRPLVKKIPSK